MLQIYSPVLDPLSMPLPFYELPISAGFPSPAGDAVEQRLDLNELLINRPAATFFIRVVGDSMIDAGIFPGDLVIIDRSKEPLHHSVVLAVWEGEFTLKQLIKENNRVYLKPQNSKYPVIEVTESMDLQIWGVAVHVVHSLSP